MHQIQVEGTFKDGVFLVTVHEPITSRDGDIGLALYGSFFPSPGPDAFPGGDEVLKRDDIPGAVVVLEEMIKINVGRERVRVKVTNGGDRPIQVGSHYHFGETNKALKFDRELALFRRLDIAAGTSVRFEPGDVKTVTLVDIGGNKRVTGGNNLINNVWSKLIDQSSKDEVIRNMVNRGFGHAKQEGAIVSTEVKGFEMSRETYASMYGPTTGDKVRLGDTALWVEIERDMTVYGDELKFGGGKFDFHSSSSFFLADGRAQ